MGLAATLRTDYGLVCFTPTLAWQHQGLQELTWEQLSAKITFSLPLFEFECCLHNIFTNSWQSNRDPPSEPELAAWANRQCCSGPSKWEQILAQMNYNCLCFPSYFPAEDELWCEFKKIKNKKNSLGIRWPHCFISMSMWWLRHTLLPNEKWLFILLPSQRDDCVYFKPQSLY